MISFYFNMTLYLKQNNPAFYSILILAFYHNYIGYILHQAFVPIERISMQQ